MTAPVARQFTCVALGAGATRRGVLIAGEPGSGKSSLALALIDRGAMLVGDDGVLLEVRDGTLFAMPHPQTRGLLEVRNIGLVPFVACPAAPVALLLRLDHDAPRFIDAAPTASVEGIAVPQVRLWPDTPMLALRAELALQRYGLPPA